MKKHIIFFALSLVAILLFALVNNETLATSGGFGGGSTQNFGGKVTKITYCTCSASTMLDIDDVRNKRVSLIYMPGVSRLYKYFKVYSSNGQKVLGTYTSGGQCMVIKGTECDSEGNPSGTIQMIGTSQ